MIGKVRGVGKGLWARRGVCGANGGAWVDGVQPRRKVGGRNPP